MIQKTDLEAELKDAMRARDRLRLEAIRMVLTTIKLAEVDKKGALDESEIANILMKEVKSLHETIEDARRADREELIEPLEAKISILEGYLPKGLTEDEIRSLIMAAIEETGATSPKQMGMVMGKLIPQTRGRADGKVVSDLVRKMLSDPNQPDA